MTTRDNDIVMSDDGRPSTAHILYDGLQRSGTAYQDTVAHALMSGYPSPELVKHAHEQRSLAMQYVDEWVKLADQFLDMYPRHSRSGTITEMREDLGY